MDISGSRFLVAGGTGFLGQKFARALLDGGATVAITGRDNAELSRVSAELNCPAIPLDYTDPGSVRAAASAVVHELGGLDGLLIATGAVAFGPVGEIGNEIETGLMRINATGPMELVSVLLDELAPGGAVVAVTAVVAEFPTAGMAAYSASKAALAAYLAALRRERRKDLATVLEVSPGHMETGFADRALAGSPPVMPEGADVDLLVETVMEALADNRREVRYDMRERGLNVK